MTTTTDEQERQAFERSFERPRNFFRLSEAHQWEIDSRLGLLDWEGRNLTAEDHARFKAHYR